MRLWSLHPCILDSKGLVALWREGLLAQAVLAGKTRGYLNHPQLDRFKAVDSPLSYIAAYLHGVAQEADARNFRFDRKRIIGSPGAAGLLEVKRGQLMWEREHLASKFRLRAPEMLDRLTRPEDIAIHPLFRAVTGGVEDWERR